MVLKIIEATQAKVGTTIMVDGVACTVRSIDVSKTGKHGSAKCRIEAVGIIDGKKKVIAVPGHERFDVPLIDKRKAQVLTATEDNASIMDLENFETIDVPCDDEVKGKLAPDDQVEYWDIEGVKIIKRKF